MSVTTVLRREVTWAEAWALTSQILQDPFSHTVASVSGWAYAPAPAQVAALDLFEGWANAKRGKNSPPIRLDRPWTKPAPAGPAEVTDQQAARRTRLEELLFGTGDPPPDTT